MNVNRSILARSVSEVRYQKRLRSLEGSLADARG